MNAFFDTNVFVAAVTKDTDRSALAVKVLNQTQDGATSIVNLMELRTVLSKKKGFDRARVEQIERTIAQQVDVTFPDASDIVAANNLQRETLLYPMDAIILTAAKAADCTLVTFDKELVSYDGLLPSELL